MANMLDVVAGLTPGSGFDPLGDFVAGREARSKLTQMKLADQARPLMGQALQGDKNALNSLAGIDPQGFIDVSKYQAGQQKAQSDDAAAKAEKVAAVLYRADTPEKWAQTINYLKQTGHQISPEEENFANRDAVLGEFLSLKEQMGQANSDRSFNADQTYHQQTLGLDRERLALERQKALQPDKPPAPPTGFRWGPNGQDGNPTLEPIAGGPASPIDMADESTAGYIKSIANNKVKPPSSGRNPQQRANVIKEVLKINPNWDETKIQARQKQADSFAAGPLGNTARSLGVGVAHLDVLQGLGDALQNGDVQMVNAAKQEWARQFGGEAPVDFEAAKSIVADEIAKGVIGGQNAQSDREALASSVRSASSPEQLKGVITTFQKLMGGQLGGLRQQYQSVNPGADDFDERFLSPETARILEQFSGGSGSNDPALEDALGKYQ